jgi:hypothetical protein
VAEETGSSGINSGGGDRQSRERQDLENFGIKAKGHGAGYYL